MLNFDYANFCEINKGTKDYLDSSEFDIISGNGIFKYGKEENNEDSLLSS